MTDKLTEADLCAAFTARARACGWEVYAETGGWDLLLVWTGDAPPPVSSYSGNVRGDGPVVGFYGESLACLEAEAGLVAGDQWGIQAKLRGGMEVINQALSGLSFLDYGGQQNQGSPDFRGVLVPVASSAFAPVCEVLRLDVQTPPGGVNCWHVDSEDGEVCVTPPRYRWKTAVRHALPPVVPAFVGGHSSPKVLSHWRLGALRVSARLRAGEHLTPADFRACGVNHKLFVQRRWIHRVKQATVAYDAGKRVATPSEYAMHPDVGSHETSTINLFPDVGYEAERDALAALGAEVPR